MKNLLAINGLLAVVALTGCAEKMPYDYTVFREIKPASILALPAENHSVDINAAHSFALLATQPLAGSGYYTMCFLSRLSRRRLNKTA